jgi:hypothetical protein
MRKTIGDSCALATGSTTVRMDRHVSWIGPVVPSAATGGLALTEPPLVLGMRDSLKMSDTDAGRRATQMVELKLVGYRAVHEFVSDSMRQAEAAGEPDHAVSLVVNLRGPNQARTWISSGDEHGEVLRSHDTFFSSVVSRP